MFTSNLILILLYYTPFFAPRYSFLKSCPKVALAVNVSSAAVHLFLYSEQVCKESNEDVDAIYMLPSIYDTNHIPENENDMLCLSRHMSFA